MPRTPIPPGITREDVIRAIADLKAGTVTHEFHESEQSGRGQSADCNIE